MFRFSDWFNSARQVYYVFCELYTCVIYWAYGKTILKIVLPWSFTRCQPPLNISLRQIFSLSCVGTAPTTHTHYSRVIHTTRARGDNSCNCLTRVAHYLNLTDGHDNLIDCCPVCFSHRITKQYFVLVTLKPTPKT